MSSSPPWVPCKYRRCRVCLPCRLSCVVSCASTPEGRMGRRLVRHRHHALPSDTRAKPFGYSLLASIPIPVLLLASVACVLVSWSMLNAARTSGMTEFVTIVKVIDGDQIVARLSDDRVVKIRLRGIDAPELDQPYGPEAAAALRDLVLKKSPHTDFLAYFLEVAPGGLHVADVYQQDSVREPVSIQRELARRGLAWQSGISSPELKLKEATEEAVRERRGIWADDSPTPPWKHRYEENKRKRDRKSTQKH
eukprot:Sspe_Gene.112761::Locus_96090_Transcript_1_1_Confidence_1.000_Length_964::g.112761::m.112761